MQLIRRTTVLSKSMTPFEYWGSSHTSSVDCSVSILISWLPPLLGVVKINCDASVISQMAAAGYIIRDHQARLVQAGDKFLMHASMPFAELIAV